jgi:hypothetical protein
MDAVNRRISMKVRLESPAIVIKVTQMNHLLLIVFQMMVSSELIPIRLLINSARPGHRSTLRSLLTNANIFLSLPS